jgi:hypothetical protein
MAMVQKFNAKRNEMVVLKSQSGERLKNAYIPPEIQKEGLFNMDVDSNLWEVVSSADDFPSGKVPDWLGDDNVRRGIRFVQDYLNADREAERCLLEFNNLKDWYQDEYQVVASACQLISG